MQMPEEEAVQTGVEQQGSDAGNQDELDLEQILFGDDSEETGEEKPDAGAEETEQEEGEQKGQEQENLPEDASKAFAKKWDAEKDKIRDEVRTEVVKEMQQRTQTTQQQQNQGAPKHREMSQSELEKMATDYDTSPAVMKILYNQQQQYNRLADEYKKQSKLTRERTDYNEAKQFAQEHVEKNNTLPAWDDEKVKQYRIDHYKSYGTSLPWKEAYRMYISDAVISGDLTRQTQQETLKNIQQREQDTSGLKQPSSKKPSIKDLPKKEFDKMVNEAKAGTYKRSEE